MKRALFGFLLVSAVSLSAFAEEKSDMQKAEEQVVLFEKLVDVVTVDKGNCPKMAADVNKYVADNKARIAELDAWAKKLPEEQKKKLEDKYKARMESGMKKMQAAVNTCASDKGVQGAFAKLKGG
jgi:Skp family chaperone for outer membrane proteins